MKPDARGRQGRRAETDQVHVEARKPAAINDAARVPLAHFKGHCVTATRKIDPAQALFSCRLENHLFAAVGKRVKCEILRAPRRGAVGRLHLDPEVVENDVQIEGKAADLFRRKGEGYAWHRRPAVQRIQLVGERARHDPPVRTDSGGKNEEQRKWCIKEESAGIGHRCDRTFTADCGNAMSRTAPSLAWRSNSLSSLPRRTVLSVKRGSSHSALTARRSFARSAFMSMRPTKREPSRRGNT